MNVTSFLSIDCRSLVFGRIRILLSGLAVPEADVQAGHTVARLIQLKVLGLSADMRTVFRARRS